MCKQFHFNFINVHIFFARDLKGFLHTLLQKRELLNIK